MGGNPRISPEMCLRGDSCCCASNELSDLTVSYNHLRLNGFRHTFTELDYVSVPVEIERVLESLRGETFLKN